MAKGRGSGPVEEEPTLDVEKLRRFLSAPKAAVEAIEARCRCGPVRAANRPTSSKQRKQRSANRSGSGKER